MPDRDAPMLIWRNWQSGAMAFRDARTSVASPEALASFWSGVLDEFEAADHGLGWEILVIYVTFKCGHVLVYPSRLTDPSSGAETLRIRLYVDAWDAEFKRYDSVIGDHGSYIEYCRLLRTRVAALGRAIEDPTVLPRFEALKARPNFAVYSAESVEWVHRADLQLVWGERPEPWVPTESAVELFRWLLRVSEGEKSQFLGFEGTTLRSVVFVYDMASDAMVETLEAVPDVASLCRDLREITLDETPMTPGAIERLKRLLPDVKIREKKPRGRKRKT